MSFILRWDAPNPLRRSKRRCAGTAASFLVAQREMDVEEPALRDLYSYGVIAEIKQVLRVSEDLVKVLVEGKTRARLLELEDGEKYLQATVRPVPVRGIGADKRTQTEALVRQSERMLRNLPVIQPADLQGCRLQYRDFDEPAVSQRVHAANLLMKYSDKQAILNESTLLGRMEKLLTPAAAGMPGAGDRTRPGYRSTPRWTKGSANIICASRCILSVKNWVMRRIPGRGGKNTAKRSRPSSWTANPRKSC